ncbi:MAG: hypothetical protein Q7T53_02945 [Deltaproteobacteria bacterium]|nr:hypothetical protein [Deltaproteobacteria bacterium]
MKIFKPIAALIIFLFLSISQAHAAEIAVIVNASGPLVSVSEADIADIYLGEKRFQDDIKIVPLLYPEGAAKEAFLRETVRMTQKEYKLYWTKKIFQEGTPIPKTPASPADIINTVKETEGAIGFLPKEILKDLSGIKIIMVIGIK